MKIFIDIGHPAQVHLFSIIAYYLNKKNHKIVFCGSEKDVSIDLLNYYGYEYFSKGKNKSGIIWKIIYSPIFIYRILKYNIYFKPDLLVCANGNFYLPIVAFLLSRPCLVFDNTEHAKKELFIIRLFSSAIITPACYLKNFGTIQIRYNGYHELAYLSPKYFVPQYKIFDYLKISPNDKYIILRFVSWNASHDAGQSGIDLVTKYKIVNILSRYAKIFISSECELPDDLKKYKISIPPFKMHDALYYATLFIGEGATMASECACLGTPAIYVNSLVVGYCTELEKKYGLIFNFRNSKGVLEKAIELLNTPNLKENWLYRLNNMLNDKIDVTAFIVWFIENYPKSFKIMKENPEYQNRFK